MILGGGPYSQSVCDVEPGSGGWAIAKKDLAPGQIVLLESPLVSGPGRNGKPICLACYSFVDAEYYCSECGWQLCSEVCELAKSPHRSKDQNNKLYISCHDTLHSMQD